MKGLAAMSGALAVAASAFGGDIDPALRAILDTAAADQEVSVLAYLVDQVDVDALTGQMDLGHLRRGERHATVVRELRSLSQFAQADLLTSCNQMLAAGELSAVEPHWIVNCVRIDAVPDRIRAIAARPEIDRVFYNFEIGLVEPVAGAADGACPPAGGPEPGLVAIRAPEVWDMGYTGDGVLVASLDTGVDGQHPALSARWAGAADPRYAGNPGWAFFDPVTGWTEPQDGGLHGTHTMGTICGGAPGDSVGVAPDATWINAAVIDRVGIDETVADAISAMEWMLDPDGDPVTTWDVPGVCSNSWGIATVHGSPECDQTFWSFIDACEAAGIVMIFAAGNEGGAGLRRPADRATDEYRSLAVAAVDAGTAGWPITGFSSRGPTTCTPDGSAAIKPDISAPGLNIRSTIPLSTYGCLNGTSMATPHISGVVALMLEANPGLAPPQVKQILYDSAVDLGAPGKDNDYGWGMIDAVAAVQMAEATVGVTFDYTNGLPVFVNPDGTTLLRVAIDAVATAPVPKTAVLYVSTGSAFEEIPMYEVEPDVYEAAFPSSPCGTTLSYYLTVETEIGATVASPFNAPDVLNSTQAYTGSVVTFQDDFQAEGQWSIENIALIDGAWERGVPAGNGLRGDPTVDSDGSGACFLTDNVIGNSDVDGGPTLLVSPVISLASLLDPQVGYDRWIANDDGDGDALIVEIAEEGTEKWIMVEAATMVAGGWNSTSFRVLDFMDPAPDAIRVRFSVADNPNDSVTEAAIDAVRVWSLTCAEMIVGDIDADGDVDFGDLLLLLSTWGPCNDCPADLDFDGAVNFADVLLLISNWG